MTGAAAMAAALFLMSPPVLAQDQPSAVGRLSTQKGDTEGGFCTGALIAPDLVMTAGHCLPSPLRSGSVTYDFAPGYGRGVGTTRYTGSSFIDLPPRPEGPLKLENDIAFLRLDQPVPENVAIPLEFQAGTIPETMVFWGYDGARPERRPVPGTCDLLAVFPYGTPTILGLSCRAVGGNSGAPVLVRNGDQWRIVAVMVARTKGRTGSMAVVPPANLLQTLSTAPTDAVRP